jgi:hypothetical protein
MSCGECVLQATSQAALVEQQQARLADLESSVRQWESRCADLRDLVAGHEARCKEAAAEVMKGNDIIEKLQVCTRTCPVECYTHAWVSVKQWHPWHSNSSGPPAAVCWGLAGMPVMLMPAAGSHVGFKVWEVTEMTCVLRV